MIDDEIAHLLNRENITLASYQSRTLAYIVDEFLVSALFIAIIWDSIPSMTSQEQMLNFISANVIQIILIRTIYHSFFVWMYGATLGKMFFKIRVISIDLLDNPTFLVSLLRAVGRTFSENVLFLGFVWAFFDSKKQTWHDKFAKTLVING